MGTIAAMSNRVDLGEDETWVATLEARSYLYALFQILFGSEPTHERLEAMSTKATDDALCIWYGDESAIRHELAAALDTALEDDSEAAKAEFTRLFLGPAKLPVPVWETVFRDEEPFLFSKFDSQPV